MTRTLEPALAPLRSHASTLLVAPARVLLAAFVVLAAPVAVRAVEASSNDGPVAAASPPLPQLVPSFPPVPERPGASAPPSSPHLQGDRAAPLPMLNRIVPIVEVGIFNAATWAVDRYALNADFARVTPDTIAANLQGGWTFDGDDFHTNEMLHPYMGSVYHTAARSAGWSFGEAMALDFAGSLAWKIAGENTKPSINDQITTTLGGAVLGEVLYRVSRLVLAGPGRPGAVRRVASAVIAPAASVNDAVLNGTIPDPSPTPQRFLGRVSLGASTGSAATRTGDVRLEHGAFIGLHLLHGVPGEVELSEPFDHFDVQLDFSSATLEPWNRLDDVGGPTWLLAARGLIVGGQDRLGDDGGVLYGLFATIDYGGPQLQRVAEAGIGPGLTLAARPASSLALDGTLLASATFGSGGAWVPPNELRDYRYGFGTLLLAEGRAWIADRLELSASARGYLVPAAVSGGGEMFLLEKGSARFRVAGPHALGLETTLSHRWADYPGSAYAERSRLTFVTYSLLFGRQ